MRRILTIDGGGIKGVFPAAFLATLENELGAPIGDYFDLIAGTSTGGIIAMGLGLGLTARELHGLYRDAGRRIFKRRFPRASASARNTRPMR
jgi:patatin-like phospholipase/acyl hydrolase